MNKNFSLHFSAAGTLGPLFQSVKTVKSTVKLVKLGVAAVCDPALISRAENTQD